MHQYCELSNKVIKRIKNKVINRMILSMCVCMYGHGYVCAVGHVSVSVCTARMINRYSRPSIIRTSIIETLDYPDQAIVIITHQVLFSENYILWQLKRECIQKE